MQPIWSGNPLAVGYLGLNTLREDTWRELQRMLRKQQVLTRTCFFPRSHWIYRKISRTFKCLPPQNNGPCVHRGVQGCSVQKMVIFSYFQLFLTFFFLTRVSYESILSLGAKRVRCMEALRRDYRGQGELLPVNLTAQCSCLSPTFNEGGRWEDRTIRQQNPSPCFPSWPPRGFQKNVNTASLTLRSILSVRDCSVFRTMQS